MIRIFLTNLGKYNEGELVGEWVDLPIFDDELNEVLERIGIGDEYEEWFITDYETDTGIEIDEYSNIYRLNELAFELDSLSELYLVLFKSIMEVTGDTPETCLEILRRGDFSYITNVKDTTHFGARLVEEGLVTIPEDIVKYVDYELIGNDFLDSGWYLPEEDIAIIVY